MSDQIQTQGTIAPGVVQGKGVAPFTKRQLLSVRKHNEIAAYCDALSRARITRSSTDAIILTPGGMVFQLGPEGSGGPGGSGMNYRGEYDNANEYFVGDVVRVTTGSTYPHGVWICVIAQSAVGAGPAWPEPSPANWNLFAFGVNTLHYEDPTDSCSAKKMDINSTTPVSDP